MIYSSHSYSNHNDGRKQGTYAANTAGFAEPAFRSAFVTCRLPEDGLDLKKGDWDSG